MEDWESLSRPAVAVCSHHGRYERALACTRCGRPTCPLCLTQAPVGSHCPECLKEGSREQKVVSARAGRHAGITTVVRGLLAVNIAVFVLQQLGTGGGPLHNLDLRYAMLGVAVAHGQWWRLFTAAFLHAGIVHIGFNMLALYSFGPSVEKALGRVRFLALYGAAALGGSTASYLFGPSTVLALGASGAIFGVFGAYFVIGRRVNADTSQVMGLIVINLLFGFIVPNIDWRAHIGGLLTGAAVAWALSAVPPGRWRPVTQAAAVVASVLVLGGLVAARSASLA